MDKQDFKHEVEERGGFESVKFSPHMRFRAGQRGLDWSRITEEIESGSLDRVEENRNPNKSIPYERALLMFITVDGQNLTVPVYFLENGTMKAVTVMRE